MRGVSCEKHCKLFGDLRLQVLLNIHKAVLKQQNVLLLIILVICVTLNGNFSPPETLINSKQSDACKKFTVS